ncbi:hypothetical protein CC80DRAFT_493439, partial [Byssothecium circinans]
MLRSVDLRGAPELFVHWAGWLSCPLTPGSWVSPQAARPRLSKWSPSAFYAFRESRAASSFNQSPPFFVRKRSSEALISQDLISTTGRPLLFINKSIHHGPCCLLCNGQSKLLRVTSTEGLSAFRRGTGFVSSSNPGL